jgi:hypothetical protein
MAPPCLDRKTTNHLSEASQQVIGKYRFTPFTEENIKGWTISVQNYGKVGHIEEPSNKSSTAPFKIYRSNTAVFPAGKKAFVQGVLRMSAYPGTETRIVSEKEIRFAPRQLLKAVAMWLDKNGGMKEGVENTEMVADETQSLDEVQFITPKVPLKGGSNSNSKEKTDYKLYVELKDVVKDAIGILSEAELKIRNPSKNSNLSVLGTIHQANQRLKHAINFGLR